VGGVLVGFAIIGFVIVVGYAIQRAKILPPDALTSLNRFVFFVANPALLFTVIARADLTVIFSSFLVVTILCVAIAAGLYLALSALFFRRPLAETVIGAAGSSYVNANNIGLPVAVYVLGSAQFVAPLLMFQLIVLAPITLTLLDVSTRGVVSIKAILMQPVRNPIILGSLAGFVVAASGWQVPDALLEPFVLIGGAAVPVVLIAFGMSLAGQRPLSAGSGRREIRDRAVRVPPRPRARLRGRSARRTADGAEHLQLRAPLRRRGGAGARHRAAHHHHVGARAAGHRGAAGAGLTAVVGRRADCWRRVHR
jgi:malonate transporter